MIGSDSIIDEGFGAQFPPRSQQSELLYAQHSAIDNRFNDHAESPYGEASNTPSPSTEIGDSFDLDSLEPRLTTGQSSLSTGEYFDYEFSHEAQGIGYPGFPFDEPFYPTVQGYGSNTVHDHLPFDAMTSGEDITPPQQIKQVSGNQNLK